MALLLARAVNPVQEVEAKTPGPQILPDVFWTYIAAAGMLALGFVDFPLLAYRFRDAQLSSEAAIPLLYSGAMAVNGLTAMVFGRLFDRFGILVLVGGFSCRCWRCRSGSSGAATAMVVSVACWATGLGVQDACLRAGIAQVVSMNKRGTAFGTFNGVYGVMWFLGSGAMGWLYSRSVVGLVVFGVTAQVLAAMMFFGLRGRLAAARVGLG